MSKQAAVSVEAWSVEKTRLERAVKQRCVASHFMHVDLAGSTVFKTRHPELEWLVRLKKFQEVVLDAVESLGLTVKLLGDGILLSAPQAKVSAIALREAAVGTLTKIAEANTNLLGERKIVARIILSSGEAFLFANDDPQGSAVDKLFRMEKLVPDDCIGMTDDFLGVDSANEAPVAYFPLKGLPKEGNHGLYLVDTPLSESNKKKLLEASYAASLWLPTQGEPRRFHVVGGYIHGPPNLVQVGDMRAKIGIIEMLRELGSANVFDVCESSDFPDEALQNDVICVGGPCFNTVTEHMLDGLPVYFDCDEIDPDDDDTPLIERGSNERFEAKFEGDRLTRDWGIFVRRRNPNNLDRTVIVACGIESPAVDGIVRAFRPSKNPNFLQLIDAIRALGNRAAGQSLPDFYCIMPFAIEDNGRAVLPTFSKQSGHIRLLE